MWGRVEAGLDKGKNYGTLAEVYEDFCVKEPDLFVWVVCSRNLKGVAPGDLERINLSDEQRGYNARHPYAGPGEPLPEVDALLAELRALRPCALLEQDVATDGDFPSTYHFRICDFAP
jgi:hypothetical protein